MRKEKARKNLFQVICSSFIVMSIRNHRNKIGNKCWSSLKNGITKLFVELNSKSTIIKAIGKHKLYKLTVEL